MIACFYACLNSIYLGHDFRSRMCLGLLFFEFIVQQFSYLECAWVLMLFWNDFHYATISRKWFRSRVLIFISHGSIAGMFVYPTLFVDCIAGLDLFPKRFYPIAYVDCIAGLDLLPESLFTQLCL